MVQKDNALNYQLDKLRSSPHSFVMSSQDSNTLQVTRQNPSEISALAVQMRSAPKSDRQEMSENCDASARVGNTMDSSWNDASGNIVSTTGFRCSSKSTVQDTSKNTALGIASFSEPGNCYSIAHRKDILRLDSENTRVSDNILHDFSLRQCSVSCYQSLIRKEKTCDKNLGDTQYCETIVPPCREDSEKFKYNIRHRSDVKSDINSRLGSSTSVRSREPSKNQYFSGCDANHKKTSSYSSTSTTRKDKWHLILSTFLLGLLLTAGSASPVTVYKVNRRPETSNNVASSSEKHDDRLSPSRNSSYDASATSRRGSVRLNASATDTNLTSDLGDFGGFIISSYTGPPTSLAGASEGADSRKNASRTPNPDRDFIDWMNLNGINADEVQGSSKQVSDYDDDFDAALMQPLTDEEEGRIRRFDPARFNYTALRLLLDSELQVVNRRQGRFFDTGAYAYRLPRFLTHLGRMLDIETVVNEIETSIMTSVSCNACKGGVGLLQHYIEQGKTKEDIVRAASKLCTNFRVETPRVCFGIIQLMSDEVVYVMENLVMEPDGICGFLIGDVCGIPHDPYHKWRVLFPPYPKPPVPLIKPPKEDMPTFKVLHLSDTHFDPYYEEGSNADCNEPMCCRRTSGQPKTEAARAGKWGDYRKCDTPGRTIKSMFENIAHTHPDIDYILWTGDLPPHDIWNQTRDSNLLVLRETVQQLFDYFPNTPVFPALGNHESAPVNSFPPPSIPAQHSVQWLYNELERQWRRWLPAYTSPTILKGGYYSVQVVPGFRIVSLNMNYCNNKNWWLLLDSEDPADQLQWLVYELQAAELKNEKVHIIGHIPPGYHDCLRVWSHNFYTIVNRFESTVTAQFYGHTHFDEFEIFYEQEQDNSSRASNVAFVSPSVTTYDALNPGYRLFYFEGGPDSNYRVVDHETWVMNLDEANHPNNALLPPHWYPLYSARSAYDMRSLLPADWDNLVYRMVEDDDLFKMFYRHYWKNSPKREECDSECKKRILCDLRSGRSNDRAKTCAVVHERVEAQERSQWRNWIFSGFTVTYVWIKKKLGF